MVIANSSLRLREILAAIIDDNNIFANINFVSLSTIDRDYVKPTLHFSVLQYKE